MMRICFANAGGGHYCTMAGRIKYDVPPEISKRYGHYFYAFNMSFSEYLKRKK